VQWPQAVPGNAATDFVATSVRPLVEKDLLSWFKSASGRKRRVFVFVHGFNTPFGRAVFRFAQIAHDADADAAPVLFSWPSRGRLLDYKRDLDNASYSRSDLAHLLEIASQSASVSEIVILAHSMGAWLAVEALRQVALERGGVPRRITNLVLASPDLDVGVFRRQIEDMGPRRPQVTLFVSQADRALQLSRIVARGGTRLGAVDLSLEEYRSQLDDVAGLTILDLTALRSGDRINHDLYAQSPAVVRLIGNRLIQGQVITDADVSPGAGADAVGSAAGFLIALPILALDAATPRQ
jgi:esterase/lipase superfamily enzyme